jgi:hypothetical protein
MNTNEKGNIGQIEVIRKLVKNGYECFLPMHDYSAIDLIAVKGEKIHRLQIKYRTSIRGVVEIHNSSVVNGRRVPIDLSMIDGWAIYCPEIDDVVFVGKKDIDDTSKMVSFRFAPGGNQVVKGRKKLRLYTEFTPLNEWS